MKLPLRSILLAGTVLLLPIALILNFFVFQKSQEETYLEAIEEKIQQVEVQFVQDQELFLRQLGSDTVSFDRISISESTHPFFVTRASGELLYWSDYGFTLDFSQLDLSKQYQVISAPYGTFLAKVQPINPKGEARYLVQAYRLIWPGNIQNDYLQTGPNPELFGNALFTLYTNPAEGSYQVNSPAGAPLFGIDFQLGFASVGKALNTPLLIFIGSLFMLYVLVSFNFLRKKWRKGRQWQAIGYGFLILVLVRVGMLLLDFPEAYLNLSLFDPVHYSSAWAAPSLGDLLLNTGCFVGVFALLLVQLSSKASLEKFTIWRERVRLDWFLFFAYAISTLFFVWLWIVPRDLVLHAQWALDVTSIPSFDGLKGVSFLILFLWASVYVLLSLSLLRLLSLGSEDKALHFRTLLIFAVPVLAAFFFWSLWLGIAGLVHFLFLFSILRFDLFTNVFRLGLETFLTLFYGSLVGAAIVAASSYETADERLVQDKQAFASEYLIASDEKTALLLDDIFIRLKSDLFVQNRLGDPLLSKDPIVSKIRKIYLDNYFDQFEVVVRIFSPTGRQIGGSSEGGSLKSLQQQYIKSDYATEVKDLYFLRDKESGKGDKFVAFIPQERGTSSLGTIYLELTQLKVQSGSAYPRLLLDKKYVDQLETKTFDYGVFTEGVLVRSSGSFNYLQEEVAALLKEERLGTSGLDALGYQHVGVKNGEELIVLSSPSATVDQFFGTASLFFVVFVCLTFLAIVVGIFLQGYQSFEVNYSTKLQLYLNFAFFFPIIIISLITTGLLSQGYRDDLNGQYLQKATLIKGNLVRFFGGQNLEALDRDALTEEINTLATTIGSDIHLYSPEGLLLASSRSSIFEKKLLSNYINPEALAGLVEKNQGQLVAEERVGKLNYQTVYLSIPSQLDPSLSAILAIPFFESEEELNAMISDVLGRVFNAFVVIFILFLLVSFLVTKSLTHPFRLLTQKLKSTNLEANEPMVWASKDEIGLLVNEYNQMLYKLEASKKVLASTEKESAWREMAKQVAHEIKNPLTPMKLTLQHLLRLDKEGKLDDADKLKKSLETLIHQVDALSGIASSFATFAKMPLPNNELLNFKEVVVKVFDLFRTDKRMQLDFKDDTYTDQISILGDEALFGRVISNLIINGMQAVAAGTKPHIRVWLWMTDKAVFLEIADNGKGIPVALRDKIFIPNFSTKSQGSGLGLAIAKSGVETAGGKIWFETEEGKGSTFFLTFPLVSA